MMKAIGLKQKGSIDRLEELEVPIPELQPHDILVKMEAVGMNPVDTKVRAKPDHLKEPCILGFDGVGTVEKLGPEASIFKEGDKVWLAGDISRNGTNADYIAVDERIVGYAPAKIPTAQAAAVPLVMLTAWEGVFEQLGLKAFDPSNEGKTLLMLPGAGGVGSFVIQLAKKLCGLTVIATASRPESEAAVRELGTDYVISHRKSLREQLSSPGLSGVDYIYNAYKTEVYFDQYCSIINPLGKIVSIVETDTPLSMTRLMLKRVTFSWELMFTRALFDTDKIQQHYILNNAARLVDSGLIQLPAVQVLPYSLENLKNLHEQQESGKMIGKAVLEM